MLEHWIKTSIGWIALKPVALELLPVLEDMLTLLRVLKYDDQDLAAKILHLHERLDPPGLSILMPSHIENWRELFVENGYIEQINAAIAPPSNEREADEVPPWASGNYLDDWLADLTYCLGDYRQAKAFIQQNSLQTVMNFLRRTKDLHKGAKGREDDANKELYWNNLHLLNFEDSE